MLMVAQCDSIDDTMMKEIILGNGPVQAAAVLQQWQLLQQPDQPGTAESPTPLQCSDLLPSGATGCGLWPVFNHLSLAHTPKQARHGVMHISFAGNSQVHGDAPLKHRWKKKCAAETHVTTAESMFLFCCMW